MAETIENVAQVAKSWNTEILAQVAEDDNSPNQIVTRTAKRIVEKGFYLIDVKRESGRREGFNWGRSSFGETNTVFWMITFEDENGNEHQVNVSVQTTTYTRRNPYDRVPKDHGKAGYTLMANDATKQALGWQKPKGH